MSPANWPITGEELRIELEYEPSQAPAGKLDEFAAAACERIDLETGRNKQPTRHLLPDGDVPISFRRAAFATAKLWWWQEFNGGQNDEAGDVPMGADLPRRVQSWLKSYPPRPGIS